MLWPVNRLVIIGAVIFLAAMVAPGLPAFAAASSPAETQAPANFRILTEYGDVIEVAYERLVANPAADRCEICFKASSRGVEVKTFVMDSQEVITFDGYDLGPRCFTRFNGFEQESADQSLSARRKQIMRRDGAERREGRPKWGQHRVDFYRGPWGTAERRLHTRGITTPPGFRVVLTWLQDARRIEKRVMPDDFYE